ncbi:hypothetical protein Hte_010762 [Hypoxylon texense]
MDASTTVETATIDVPTTISLSTTTYATTIPSPYTFVEIYTKPTGLPHFIFSLEKPDTPPISSQSPTRSSSTASTLTSAADSSSRPPPSYSSSQSPSPSPSPSSGSTNATQQNQEYGNSNLSPGATAGIAVACVIVGLAIGAIAGFFFLGRRRHELEINGSMAGPGSQEKSSRDHLTGRQEPATGYGVFELEGQERSQELATGYNVVELPDR